MSDLVGLCLFAMFIFIGLMLLLWVMNRFSPRGTDSTRPTPNPQRNPERPRHDDPDIHSEGQFGRRPTGHTSPQVDDPDVRSRGGFGRERGATQADDDDNPLFPAMGQRSSAGPAAAPPAAPPPPPPPPVSRPQAPDDDNDDPDIRSRGGFGRDRG